MLTLYLGTGVGGPVAALEKGLNAPTVRLAHGHGAQGDNTLMGKHGMIPVAKEVAPALLVSFVYLPPFLKHRDKYVFRDWALDSGAFSANQIGTPIRLESYIDLCRELLETDQSLTEVFALDVIDDPKTSLQNAEKMWKAGVPAIPTYHSGEPEHFLTTIAKEFPKIALGGAVGMRHKSKWAEQCFARVWPKKVHGFGFGGERDVMGLPWHSVDATNWEIGPVKFGNWRSFGRMSVRGSKQNLRTEVEWYLRLERQARQKWRKQMQELEEMEDSFSLRLVRGGSSRDLPGPST